MGALKGLIVRLRALTDPHATDRGLDAEIAFHIDRETEKYIARGMPPDDARRRALVAFGGRQQMREAHRGVRRAAWIEELWRDTRHGVRTLR